MIADSKETIRSRMIRTASGLWGFTDAQDVNSFDPVVGMILGALAEELYAVYTEIKKTDSRILGKLQDILFNQHGYNHMPAHGIARAKPLQPRVAIGETSQFCHTRKITRSINKETKYENKSIYFTPTTEIHLFRAEVKYLAAGEQLFEISEQYKEPAGTASSHIPSDLSKLFIGIKADPLIDRLDGLTLMFALKNKQYEERMLNALLSGTWKINNQKVVFRPGFETEPELPRNALNEMLKEENDLSFRICRYVNDLYRKRFVILENGNYSMKHLAQPDSIPEEIRRRFPGHILKSIPGDLLWIELCLPYPVTPEMISALVVSINCFPVINRELREFSQILTKGLNIIPLNTEDLFFDIRNITDSKGGSFKPLQSFESNGSADDGYWIRQGGVARFDSLDAAEAINHLTELIRDERASFALLGTDMISTELKQLDQIITRLKQRLDTTNANRESTPYVMLNSKSNFERAFVQFWSTSGEMGNNIRADSRMTVHRANEVDPNSVVFVTATSGGKRKLTGEERMNKLRRTLLSKGRVVTPEDIKALCYEHFGSDLLKADISKGTYLHHDHNKGSCRSVDISLTLDPRSTLSGEDLEQKTEGLLTRLKLESVNLLPYRVFIINE